MKPVKAALTILLVPFIELHARPEEREIDISPFSMNLEESINEVIDKAVEEAVTQQIANIQELNVFEGPVNIYEFTGDEAQPNFVFILSEAADNISSIPATSNSFIEYASHEMPPSGNSFVEYTPQTLDVITPLTASGKASKSPSTSAKASKSPTTSAKASKSPSAGKSEKSIVPLTNATASLTVTNLDATATGSGKASKSPSASAKASKSPTTSAKASKSPSAGKSEKSIVPLTNMTALLPLTNLDATATASGKASKSPSTSAKASKSPTTSAKASKSPSVSKSAKSTIPLTGVTSPIMQTTLDATATASGKASKSPSTSAKASKSPTTSTKASKSPSVSKSAKSTIPLTGVTSPLDATVTGSGKASKSPSTSAKASKSPTKRAKSSKSASPVQTPYTPIQPYATNSSDITTGSPTGSETADRDGMLSFLSSSTHRIYGNGIGKVLFVSSVIAFLFC